MTNERKTDDDPAPDAGRTPARLEAAEVALRLASAKEQVARVHATLSYRVGNRIVTTRGIVGALRLPLDLLRIYRDHRRARATQPDAAKPAAAPALELNRVTLEALRRLGTEGAAAAAGWLRSGSRAPDEARAQALAEIALRTMAADEDAAASLALEAARLHRQGRRAREAAFALGERGAVSNACAILDALVTLDGEESIAERRRVHRLRGWLALGAAAGEGSVRAARPAATVAVDRRTIVLAARAPADGQVTTPWLRLRDVAGALVREGYRPVLALFSDWPVDARAQATIRAALPPGLAEADIRYVALVDDSMADATRFAAAAGEEIARAIEETGAAGVHALSEHIDVALAAEQSAAATARAFILDLGGFWMSGEPHFMDTGRSEREGIARATTERLARAADHVVVRGARLAPDVRALGVAAERVSVLPSPLTPDRPDPPQRAAHFRQRFGLEGRFVFGHVGELPAHGGFETLVEALALVRRRVPAAALFLAGRGAGGPAARALADRLELAGDVVVRISAPLERFDAYLGLVDTAVFPCRADALSAGASAEALAFVNARGIPAIAAGVEVDGEPRTEAVQYVPVGDANAMAEAMFDVCSRIGAMKDIALRAARPAAPGDVIGRIFGARPAGGFDNVVENSISLRGT